MDGTASFKGVRDNAFAPANERALVIIPLCDYRRLWRVRDVDPGTKSPFHSALK